MPKLDYKNSKIAIIGLGYVGLPLSIEFGKIRPVLGYDIDELRIQELLKKIDRTRESSAEDIEKAQYLQFSNEEIDLKECNIFIVTVPTPIDKANKPNLEAIETATKLISKYLKQNSLVIYESTVFPGATEEICVPILENKSGLKLNKDFFCGYSPERINPGDKEKKLTDIMKIVSGSNKLITNEIGDLYDQIIHAGTWKTSSIKIAEAAKVIENTQRDLNIAFVNELAVIFERLNIDTNEVLEAAGTKWNFLNFKPGMVGGHCIGVDPYYLTYKAEQTGYRAQVVLAGRRINDNMARYGARNIIRKMSQIGINISKAKVAVLGITFKENCPDIRNSKVFDLVSEFKSWGLTVECYDPWINEKEYIDNSDVIIKNVFENNYYEAVIVAVGHTQFRNMSINELWNICKGPKAVLGDLKSLYNKHEAEMIGFDVYRF